MTYKMTDFVKVLLVDFWATLAEMSPYLLFGFFVAGILSVVISPAVVERHLGRGGLLPLVKASLFGVPLPLCSCGVIPVAMSLHKHGAGKGAAIAFLLSTPQTGVDSIFVTLSLLGPVFAIFRPLAAFITGIVGGVLVDIFDKDEKLEKMPQLEPPKENCCSEHQSKAKKIVSGLKYGFITLPNDIGKAMLVGLLIAAAISALVPDGYFAEHLGTGIFAMVVMMLLGIPVYVCATASVPVAAALILKGLTPGAALVFLMTGPATNAASFVTIIKTMGYRAAIAYIVSVGACALLSGIILDYIIAETGFEVVIGSGWMLPDSVKYISAVILLIILATGILRKKKH
ncbi:MAG: SO_0444 family Cu/Zn efflux transporter [Planctomycetes bacterium]|nr:SO_0444 family Cu/Zn efflux transporter [Planctomycetota bacterium]